MRIVFWQSILSPHQAPYISELANRQGWSVTIVAQNEMTPERVSIGWRVPDFGAARVMHSDGRALQILEDFGPDTLHVLEGMKGCRMTSIILPVLIKQNRKIGVISETADSQGFKGALRRLAYTASALSRGRRIDFVLGIGTQGVDWYRRCGFPV